MFQYRPTGKTGKLVVSSAKAVFDRPAPEWDRLPLMHLVFRCRLMRDDEFLARHPEFDGDVKWVTASMMPKRRPRRSRGSW